MSASTDRYRLSNVVTPSAYRLVIEPDIVGGRFVGQVDIDVDVLDAVELIELNAAELEIHEAWLDDGGPLDVEFDVANERIRLCGATSIGEGRHTVHIRFAGEVGDSLHGFYRSRYQGPDGEEFLGVTQFEAPYARRAFPCWDEPGFKATFEISLICAPGVTAISNSGESGRHELDDGRVRVDFRPTISMSTYLVAWVVGRLEVSDPVVVGETPIRVVHRPGQAHLAHFALEVAAHGLDWFERYYGIAYPADKLDLIAVPDFAFGAMENLGCITFREILLLIDPELASRAELEEAAMVIDHEIAHMWFGDLVTMAWWDGLWLNEAFATLMETMCPSEFRPDWDLWTGFAVATTGAFDTDALAATRAIENPVDSPTDIEGMFDVLTYEKGAAVLRMIEQWAGPDAFRTGVTNYLERHRYGNTDADDLWRALADATRNDVPTVMQSWITQGGHPVITVSRTSNGVHLRQHRLLLEGGAPATDDRLWQVPIRLQASVGSQQVERSIVLEGPNVDVDLGGSPEWVNANLGAAGFYRTHYKGSLDPLGPGVMQLSAAERVVAVDNAMALCLAGTIGLRQVIDVIRRIAAPESNPRVWRRIANVVDQLFLLSPRNHHDLLRVLVSELVGDRWSAWSGVAAHGDRSTDKDDAAATAAVVLRLGGLHGHRGGWESVARDLVEKWDREPSSIHPELVGPALQVLAGHGDASDFDEMVARWRAAASPQDDLRIQAALAGFATTDLAERFWELCLHDLRAQDAGRSVRNALTNPWTGEAAWEFVTNRWAELTARVPSGSHTTMAGGVRSFAEPILASRVHAFFAEHPIPQGHQTLAQHLERLDVNVAARRRIEAELASTGA